jgi:AraC-like DNA-binding protein
MPDTDTPKPINIRNMDPADRQALRHAAVDAGTNLTEYIRRLCHAEAERLRAAGPATGTRFTFRVNITDPTAADTFLTSVVQVAETFGYEISGGMAQVDDNGNPTH